MRSLMSRCAAAASPRELCGNPYELLVQRGPRSRGAIEPASAIIIAGSRYNQGHLREASRRPAKALNVRLDVVPRPKEASGGTNSPSAGDAQWQDGGCSTFCSWHPMSTSSTTWGLIHIHHGAPDKIQIGHFVLPSSCIVVHWSLRASSNAIAIKTTVLRKVRSKLGKVSVFIQLF